MVWFHWLCIFSSLAMRSPKFLWAIWSQSQSCSRSFRTSEVVFTLCVRIIFIAWGNNSHFAMQLLFFLQNDVWGTSAEFEFEFLMTCLYLDLGSASDESCCKGNLPQPIRSTTQIWVVVCHQYRISALVSQMSFHGQTGVASWSVSCFHRLKYSEL